MTDAQHTIGFVMAQPAEPAPPPFRTSGPIGWMRENLFSSIGSTLLTIVGCVFVFWALKALIGFLLLDASFTGDDKTCRAAIEGACWPFITASLRYFTYARYPFEEQWRVDLWLVLGAVLIVWLLWPKAPRKGMAAILFFILFPLATKLLLSGSLLGFTFGLNEIDTSFWGGIFVTFLMAVAGIVFSLPFGILLALGRRSQMPIVKLFSVIFIEFFRGVPFITVLFMANRMLPIFVPDSLTPDTLVRPMIAFCIFSSAYMAEIVRGGLQAIPKGQFEGAMALGIGYWRMMYLIVLPQALTIVIPGIVGTFIGMFKDTTLIQTVGISDFFFALQTRQKDPTWSSPNITTTGYVFAAIFYFIFCFGMSRYARYTERKLSLSRKH
ncbi:amino acid ABC transporter permease [Methylovirgula sp. 4M-Z18]|uniref:amino acid ABC transporter permease n=1 Tax=Methylovirgula sp. 4M-Z18 TaxID=2293567 RepID=UPI000E2EB590|nr:amino acid ABC transporter permease [Methylovirgula sp. 4M-Z18]RFB80314.1 amino acid ABC transporter permease [Methylovirgula sp. 4M-Z18]